MSAHDEETETLRSSVASLQGQMALLVRQLQELRLSAQLLSAATGSPTASQFGTFTEVSSPPTILDSRPLEDEVAALCAHGFMSGLGGGSHINGSGGSGINGSGIGNFTGGRKAPPQTYF
jgi:hypothetical protein